MKEAISELEEYKKSQKTDVKEILINDFNILADNLTNLKSRLPESIKNISFEGLMELFREMEQNKSYRDMCLVYISIINDFINSMATVDNIAYNMKLTLNRLSLHILGKDEL